MSTDEIVRRNVNRLLGSLGTTPYAVSAASGHRPGWLSDLLASRSPIRSDTLDELAAALGADVADLVSPRFSPVKKLAEDAVQI